MSGPYPNIEYAGRHIVNCAGIAEEAHEGIDGSLFQQEATK